MRQFPPESIGCTHRVRRSAQLQAAGCLALIATIVGIELALCFCPEFRLESGYIFSCFGQFWRTGPLLQQVRATGSYARVAAVIPRRGMLSTLLVKCRIAESQPSQASYRSLSSMTIARTIPGKSPTTCRSSLRVAGRANHRSATRTGNFPGIVRAIVIDDKDL